MKKCLVSLYLCCLLGGVLVLSQAEDPFDRSKLRTADPDQLISGGIPVMTYPEKTPTGSQASDKKQEQQRTEMDKKVDDAIKRAWEDKK